MESATVKTGALAFTCTSENMHQNQLVLVSLSTQAACGSPVFIPIEGKWVEGGRATNLYGPSKAEQR